MSMPFYVAPELNDRVEAIVADRFGNPGGAR